LSLRGVENVERPNADCDLMADTFKTFRITFAADIALRLESALKGIALKLRQGWQTFVVAKHRCYPPEDGIWIEVSSSDAHPDCYVCPECDQHFRLRANVNRRPALN
jgi:hypothetical protein